MLWQRLWKRQRDRQPRKRTARQSSLGTTIGTLRQGPCTAARKDAPGGCGAVRRKGRTAAKPCFFENPYAILNTCGDACKPAGISCWKARVRLFRCIHTRCEGGAETSRRWLAIRLLQHRRHNASLDDKSGGPVASVAGCIGGNDPGCSFTFASSPVCAPVSSE